MPTMLVVTWRESAGDGVIRQRNQYLDVYLSQSHREKSEEEEDDDDDENNDDDENGGGVAARGGDGDVGRVHQKPLRLAYIYTTIIDMIGTRS